MFPLKRYLKSSRSSIVPDLIVLLAFLFVLTACASTAVPQPTQPVASTTFTQSPVPEKPSPTATAVPSATVTPRPSATPSPSPTLTLTASPVPTYVILRGEVTIEQAVCHYGPGKPYLYKYGVYQGTNLEVFRRVALSNYVEVQAIGGNNPCWVRVDYLDIKGNWLDLQPVPADEVVLPISPYYGPLTGVAAVRSGDQVTVSWHGLALRAGDDSLQAPYVVEAWVCQAGEYVFTPLAAYGNALTLTDEPGCAQPSRGRVLAAEKHGYTPPVEVPWPSSQTPTP